MSFPLNKRVDNLKVFNKSGSSNLEKVGSVSATRTKGETTTLTLATPIGNTKNQIHAARLLPQLSNLSVDYITQTAKQAKYLPYIVISDVRSCFFGRVAKIVSWFGQSVHVDLLCDGSKLVLKREQFRSICSKDMIFDYCPITQENGYVYGVADWIDSPPNAQANHQSINQNVGSDAITYKIQYATSDGKVFGGTWEANQYVDEQNKQRLHQKKMELLKTMAKEAGLEFEVNGSSIVLK